MKSNLCTSWDIGWKKWQTSEIENVIFVNLSIFRCFLTFKMQQNSHVVQRILSPGDYSFNHSIKNMKHTSWLAHGDRLYKVLGRHVQLSFILHGAENAEAMLMG